MPMTPKPTRGQCSEVTRGEDSCHKAQQCLCQVEVMRGGNPEQFSPCPLNCTCIMDAQLVVSILSINTAISPEESLTITRQP